MCRNIRTLHNFAPPATETEVQEAALQYVRKISGATKPSQANAAAFEEAVEEVAAATRRLLGAARHQRAAQEPRGRGGEGARPQRGPLRRLAGESLRGFARSVFPEGETPGRPVTQT